MAQHGGARRLLHYIFPPTPSAHGLHGVDGDGRTIDGMPAASSARASLSVDAAERIT